MTIAIEQIIVSAQQMRQIEGRIFEGGMPVAALMEKVATLITQKILQSYPISQVSRVGVLVGPGHNGGDALVVARELHWAGYKVAIFCPFEKRKELTSSHAQYAEHLGIPFCRDIQALANGELIIDGFFGFGLERKLSGDIVRIIDTVNQWSQPVVSIDLPSGIQTDTGEVLGTAIRATQTFCLGLWKLAFCQEAALEYMGESFLLEFGIPTQDIHTVLEKSLPVKRMTRDNAIFPLPRPRVTHKYKQGHLLLICGSQKYSGAAILAALGARKSGVGMVSIAIPKSLKPLLVSHIPESLIIECPETETGAIAKLPFEDLEPFTSIACGPGLTLDPMPVVEQILKSPSPVILDADGLNILAQLHPLATLSQREAPIILTPHLGEFKRLFPEIPRENRLEAARLAAQECGAIVLLKGARTVIADPQGRLWLIPQSTPALARGGSGDVLTGLIAGLTAQLAASDYPLEQVVATGAWWHAQGGIVAAREQTELGVDALTLTDYLLKVID